MKTHEEENDISISKMPTGVLSLNYQDAVLNDVMKIGT
jgi:hypothetical protein